MTCSAWRRAIFAVALGAALALAVVPRQASAWRYRWPIIPSMYAGYPSSPTPWGLFPGERPYYDPRRALPPGAPLSYDDPGSGSTYCWSQSTGFYFVCGYATAPPYPGGLASPMPSGPPPPPIGDQLARPASGVLLFKLPREAEATVNGVPIGLSEGLGVTSVPPGRYHVVLQMSGKEIEHTVTVGPHKIFTITPTGAVATEP